MDSFLEYIAILFLIFSFLGPLFKKDKKGKQQPKQHDRQPQKGKERKEVTLEDLFGDIFQDTSRRQKENPNEGGLLGQEEPPNIDPEPHTWNPAEEYGYQEEKPRETMVRRERQSVAEYAKQLKGKYKGLDADDLQDIIKKQKQGKSVINKTVVPSVKLYESKRSKQIKKIFHNPESVKEYILISEILNKPKALRR